MGNIVSDGSTAELDYVDKVIKLTSDQSVIGRAVVIHEGVDDFGLGGFEDSKKTGHAGGRVGCGVIGRSGSF